LKYGNLFSVVVPYFLRFEYLKGLVESVHRHADMPFEIIVHDDSGRELKSLELRDKVSTVALNFGKNLGLAAAANRAVALANGKYVLFMNQDCQLIRPCLREYSRVLDKPYVGILSPYGDPYPLYSPEWIEVDGTRFTLNNGISSGATMAFRKDFWEEIGGFEEEIISGCADTPVLYKMYRHGYFRAVVLGEKRIRNVSAEDVGNRDTTIGPYGDCGYPRVFKVSEEEYRRLSLERAVYCQRNQDSHQHEPAGISNLHYWHAYSEELLPRSGVVSSINWEAARKHGQTRWRTLIEGEKVNRG